MEKRIKRLEDEINRLANIISDNQGTYGPEYNTTIEYACLKRDYEIYKFELRIHRILWRLINTRKRK